MKPTDVIKNEIRNAYSETFRLYSRYKNEECVIAYRKCFMGVAMVIKGKKELFGFVVMDENTTKWRTSELQRKELKEIIKLFNLEDANKVIIIDEENYKLFERKVLFNSI